MAATMPPGLYDPRLNSSSEPICHRTVAQLKMPSGKRNRRKIERPGRHLLKEERERDFGMRVLIELLCQGLSNEYQATRQKESKGFLPYNAAAMDLIYLDNNA